jgi:predicted RNase H-like HicB family nuclease
MSRKSSHFSNEPQKVTWAIERIEDGRYKAQAENFDVFAFGDSEQEAMINAKEKMDTVIRNGEVPQPSPGGNGWDQKS